MRKDSIATVAVSVFVTLLALTPIGYMAVRSMPPRIATVDLQKLIEEEQQKAIEVITRANGSVSSEQIAALEKQTVDFAKNLSKSIEALGAQCNCVILNKAALLGGATIDYTDLVRDQVKK